MNSAEIVQRRNNLVFSQKQPGNENTLAILFCHTWAACQPAHQAGQDKPNIIFILADDMGYGDVSAFNPKGKTNTENLNKMLPPGGSEKNPHLSWIPALFYSQNRVSIIVQRGE